LNPTGAGILLLSQTFGPALGPATLLIGRVPGAVATTVK